MSLHKASKYLASKGRDGDSMLVHMSPREVKGLQELAMAQGGSLTINPETGLPEAGILKSLLPMIGGAALMMIPGMQGFGGALAASAIMGGGMYAATGSIKEGLLAGLGAFGGANMAGGLMAAGAEAGAAGVLEAGAAETAGITGAEAAASSTQAMDAMTRAGMSFSDQAAALGTNTAADAAAQSAAQTQAMDAMSKAGMGYTQQAGVLQGVPNMTQVGSGAGGFGTGQTPTFMQNLESAGRGLPQIGNVIAESPLKTIGAAAAPFAYGATDSGVQGFPPDQSSGGSSLASLSPNFQGYEPPQPNPYYKAQYTDYRKKPTGGMAGYSGYAGGGVVAMAEGGMDPMNPIQNSIYPQSQQMNTAFATSPQMPNSMHAAMSADYDARTNPMTGDMMPMGMASGGVAGYASGHLASSASMPAGGIYRDTDANTASLGAYEAALYRLKKNNKLAGIKTAVPKGAMTKLGSVDADVSENASGGVIKYEGGGEAAAPAAAAGPTMSGLAAARSYLGMSDAPAAPNMGSFRVAAPQGPALNAQTLAQLAALNPYANAPQSTANTQTMAQLAALDPYASVRRQAPSTYSNPYASRPVYTPKASDNYKFSKPIATKESLAREEAARQEAERIAAEQAAAQGGGDNWGYAQGGIAHYSLGGYSDGGRMLKGPGDGMSDSIPASIGAKQPARLADGEFVVPADVVSHLGNGSTDAGAKKLYGMMDKVRKARTGTKKQGKQINADKFTPK